MADSGNWEGAADRFQRAYALKATAGIAFNWASALASTGKLTEASELLQRILSDEAASREVKRESEDKLHLVRQRLAHLTVHVSDADPDLEVLIDGATWQRAVWDVAVSINPGPHLAVTRRDGRELTRRPVVLAEGEHQDLPLSGRDHDASERVAASAPLPLRPVDEEKREPRKLYKSWILWTAVGVAAVGGGVAYALTRDQNKATLEPVASGNTGPGVIRW